MKCATSKCKFTCHTNINNNGGTHCCLACKINQTHGPACQKKLLVPLTPDLQKFQPKIKSFTPIDINTFPKDTDGLKPAAQGRAWFTASEVASIYNIPAPNASTNVVVGVLSFGGGLYGNVDANGVLTNGDVQAYWSYIGIPSNKHPRVIIVPIDGATNLPSANDGGATFENSLDVETIGACCPSANLTIILYISPNSLNQFTSIITRATTTAKVINGVSYKPSIISISWGAPEIYYPYSLLTSINTILSAANSNGINICSATGDYGSNNGVGGTGSYTDFPSSSPYNTAVGGTNLVCPNNIYGAGTIETAWSGGGGAVSAAFIKPIYQAALTGSNRSTPDIALIADPATGVLFNINGSYYIFGGTSIAAPVFAGFLAACDVKTFVNPRLYAAPANCFNDIVSGSNGSFTAKSGYDNCTGLGSINGANLKPVLTSIILVNNLTLDASNLTLQVNQTSTINAIIAPTSASNKSVTWTSSNPSIVTVTAGLVTARAAGSANIVCATTDGSLLSATVAVSVTPLVPVTGVSISLSGISTIHIGTTLQLISIIRPTNATNKQVTWSKNNGNVIVSSTGLVTGVALGVSIIQCRTVSGNFTATISINVTIGVNSVSLDATSISLVKGRTRLIVPLVLPANAANKSVTWQSSRPTVATVITSGLVNSPGQQRPTSGLVTAKNRGTAIITCTTVNNNRMATVTVNVP